MSTFDPYSNTRQDQTIKDDFKIIDPVRKRFYRRYVSDYIPLV